MSDQLVKVFDSEQEPEAMVVRGLLDSAGIHAEITSTDVIRQAFPGVGGTIVLVPEDDAEEARRIIQESQRPLDEPNREASGA